MSFVTCVTCGHIGPPTETWRCQACESSLVHGLETSICESCGQSSLHRRRHYELMSLCDCHLTAAQRREAARAQEIAARKEQQAALAAQEREMEAARRNAQRYAAAKCLHESDNHCAIPKAALPFPYCSLCPRFERPSNVGQNKRRSDLEPINLRMKPIETEEIEVA